jgi:hypothetical protein
MDLAICVVSHDFVLSRNGYSTSRPQMSSPIFHNLGSRYDDPDILERETRNMDIGCRISTQNPIFRDTRQ